MPDIGTLDVYRRPSGEGIRIDDGYEEGMEIPIYYDPMIGKLVAWGANRTEAIERLSNAISDFRINGIETTLPFGKWAIHQEAFVAGKFDTHFIANYYHPNELIKLEEEEKEMIATLACLIYDQKTQVPKPLQPTISNWQRRNSLR